MFRQPAQPPRPNGRPVGPEECTMCRYSCQQTRRPDRSAGGAQPSSRSCCRRQPGAGPARNSVRRGAGVPQVRWTRKRADEMGQTVLSSGEAKQSTGIRRGVSRSLARRNSQKFVSANCRLPLFDFVPNDHILAQPLLPAGALRCALGATPGPRLASRAWVIRPTALFRLPRCSQGLPFLVR